MRPDPRRDCAVALLSMALLAAGWMPTTASAQQSGGPVAGDPPASPSQDPPTEGEEGEAAEAPIGRPSPVNLDAVPADPSPLARYIPKEAAGAFLEFPGLDAAPDAWKGSSAHGLLNETTLGAMIRELIAQVVEESPDAPLGTMTGPEAVAVAEHVARHGFIVASPQDAERSSHYRVVVLRNAAHREVRGLFGKILGTIAAEGTKPDVVSKGGGRQVVVMGPTGDWAWWIEGNDLVLVFNPADAADRVIAALDGQEPNLVDDPVRQELMADDGGFRPLAFGTWRFDRPGAGPEEQSLVRENGLKRADLRWGFDGKESLTVVRLDAPAPRSGFMTMFDQPPLALSELPPIPPDAANVSVLSLNPAALIDAVISLADQGAPAAAQPLRAFEQSVKDRARIDFRNDVLASMGPKVAVYSMPKPEERPAGRGPLAGVMSALGGLNLPQFVVAIEIDDPSTFSKKLDGMILAINQQLASVLGPGEAATPPPPREGGRRGERPPAPPEPPKFSMTLANPRTFLLKLPDGLYGLTGYQPTITMGRKYVIFGTTPVLARQCRELEAAPPEQRWSPGGDLAGRLPASMTMLFVNDPSRGLPSSVAALPATLTAAPNPPAPAPDGPQFAANAGNPEDSSSPDGSEAPGSEDSSELIGDDGSGEGGNPGGSANAGPTEPLDGVIEVPVSLIPPADAIRGFLFPAVYAVSTDDGGIRLEAREVLPGQWGLSGLGSGPILRLPLPGQGGPVPGGGG